MFPEPAGRPLRPEWLRDRRRVIPGLLLLLNLVLGCGLRQPQTGSLHGRILDAAGNVVPNARVYSIFAEEEKVFTGLDGVFYLSELPAGSNRLVITHPAFRLEEREVQVRSGETTRVEGIRLSQGAAPKFISQTRADLVTSSTAIISWRTYKPLVCTVEFGPTQGYGTSVAEREPAEDHQVTLTGLVPETVYHARIRFTDESSIVWFSYDLPFRTVTGDGPAPPTGVVIKGLPSYGVIEVAWNPSTSTSAVGYRVRRSENGGDWMIQTTEPLARDAREYRDQTARGGRFYEYVVTAIDGPGGESVFAPSPRVFMPGFVNEELRLTASDSPYILVSDLIVGVGVNLYVEPGVEFRVASADAFRLGEDPDRVEILVQGRTTMNGTAELPIRFTPLDGAGSRDHWAGIELQAGGTGASEMSFVELFGCRGWAIEVAAVDSTLRHLSVRYCEGGLRYADTRNPPALADCTFEDIASAAVLVRGCRRFQIERCTVRNAGLGVRFEAVDAEDRVTMRETSIEAVTTGISGIFSRSVIANCLVVCPKGTGVDYQAANGAENALDHCTIDAAVGVRVASGLPTIENNIVTSLTENGTTGILYTAPNAPSYHYNNVNGFATAYEGCVAGLGATAFRPEFAGGNPYDYHLLTAAALKRTDKFGLESGRYGKSFL